MFDRVVLENRSQTHHHQHNTSITEKRAPTDESVKLLQEMQQKAFDSIFLQYKIETNVVSGMVSYLVHDFSLSLGVIILWQFDLNGERYEIKEDFDKITAKMKGMQFAMEGLFKKVAETLANKMLENAVENKTVITELTKK